MSLKNSEQAVRCLIERHGEEFVKYVLNIENDSDDLGEMEAGCTLPSLEQQSAIRTLQSIWKTCAPWENTWSQYYELSAALTSYCPYNESTVVNRLRKLCGGEVEENFAYESDITLRQYLKLISAAYPIIISYLEKGADDEDEKGDHKALLGNLNKTHPARLEFLEAIENDDLIKLFPRGDNGFWLWSTGNRSNYEKGNLIDQIIHAVIHHPETNFQTTLKSLEVIARQVLSDARRLARGEEIDVPIVAGLSGISITSEEPVPLMDDLISGRPKVWLTKTLENRMIRRDRPFSVQAGLMCELVWYDKIRLLTSNPDDSEYTDDDIELEIEQGKRRRQQFLDQARLGIVASHTSYSKPLPRPAIVVEERILSPLGPNGFIIGHESERVDVFMEPPGRPPGVSHLEWLVINPANLEHIKQVCTPFLRATHNQSLALAARRLCLSLGIRNDPEDRIIDAVISAEALVGGSEKKQESPSNPPQNKPKSMSKALAKALAQLVEPKNNKRQHQLYNGLIFFINLRGRIVHGSGRKVESDESGQLTLKELDNAGAQLARIVTGAFYLIIIDDELSTYVSSIDRQKAIFARQNIKHNL